MVKHAHTHTKQYLVHINSGNPLICLWRVLAKHMSDILWVFQIALVWLFYSTLWVKNTFLMYFFTRPRDVNIEMIYNVVITWFAPKFVNQWQWRIFRRMVTSFVIALTQRSYNHLNRSSTQLQSMKMMFVEQTGWQSIIWPNI